MKHKRSKESGFTLIELLVTCVFVVAMSTTIVEVFVTIAKVNRQSRNLAVATELAQQKMEADRNLGYAKIPTNDPFTSSLPATLGSPKSATATFADVSSAHDGTLGQLDIAISYTDAGQTKKVQVTTLIALIGIDR